MSDTTPTPLIATIAPRTGKIIKNGLRVFKREEHLLQNGILHFVFRVNREKLRWKVKI